jgi:hypothetical protein
MLKNNSNKIESIKSLINKKKKKIIKLKLKKKNLWIQLTQLDSTINFRIIKLKLKKKNTIR